MKVLVQKSGYFARSAAAGHFDRALIQKCAAVAVQAAMRGESGVVGEDDDNDKRCGVIAFERIKGGKVRAAKYGIEVTFRRDF